MTERSVDFKAEGKRLSAAPPARTTGEKYPARKNTEVPAVWLCQADIVSRAQILGAPQVKGRTWLWSEVTTRVVLGPSPVKQTAVPLSPACLGMTLQICTFISFLCCCSCLPEAAPASCSWQGFLQGHLNLSISSLGWVGTAHLYNPGTRGMMWGMGGAACRALILSSPRDWDRVVLLQPL